MNLIDREHNSILQTYKRLPIEIDRAEGCYIYDKNGNKYLDFLAGIAVNALGHSHNEIINAINAQMKRYMHVSNYFYQDVQIELAEKLKEISGFSKVFFSNSGAESTEGAIKLIRKWGSSIWKNTIFGLTGGFHGRTYGALSIMDKPLYKENMGQFLQDCYVIKFNDLDDLEKNINEKTAAVVFEFIQGEGGICSISKEYIDKLKLLKEKYNFLIVADEIQAGIGRTGKYFAFQHYDITPDIVLLAKGIGGGLPLGAILVTKELENVFAKGNHGTTYGGNALACVAGLTVLKELEKGVLDNVNEVGDYFISKLKQLKEKFQDEVLEVRGKGLILGLLLNFDAQKLVDKLLEKRIITNAASGFVLRIVPPLIITKENVDEFIIKLEESLKDIKNYLNE